MNTVINPCDSSPCANNSSCIPVGPFDNTCECTAGYTGPRCEVNIDDCQSAVCPNNSMCVDGVNDYKCICDPDFMQDGKKCVQNPVTSQEETQG